MNPLEKMIVRPTLLLNSEAAGRNIEKMLRKATASGVRFRPHFKTHQSAGIGEWFRKSGVSAITVSSVDMATYFAEHGWQDITIAFPVNLRQIEAINALAAGVSLNLLLDSVEAADQLGEELKHKVGIWLKIDTGYHRTGIAWDDQPTLMSVLRAVQKWPFLDLEGILTHAGHTYGAGSPTRIVDLYWETQDRMQSAKETLRQVGQDAQISVGDTPGCSLVENFGDVDEVRPGNFIFYDLSQLSFGSCHEEEIAVAVACPVVSKNPERKQIVLYGGAVHLSKESIASEDGRPLFGRIALLQGNGWSPTFADSSVISLTQEHAVVRAEDALFDSVGVGDLVAVLPVHSCLTVNLHNHYLTLEGEVIDKARL